MARYFFGPTAQDLSADVRERLIRRADPGRYVIPVFRGKGRDETLIGSGTLLAVGNAKFFCTAAHVFDALARTPLVLHGEGPAHLIKAQPHVTQLPHSGRKDDKYDLLIDRFGEDRSRWFSQHRFITVDNVDQDEFPDNRGLLYMFAGCPASANRRRGNPHPPKLATYAGEPFGPEKYESYGFVPNMHLIIGFRKKHMWNELGQVVTPTDPHGISGGPVWRLGHVSDIERGTYEPKLVGVGLEYRPDALVALRLSFVLETIRSLHPELSPDIPSSQWIRVNATTAI